MDIYSCVIILALIGLNVYTQIRMVPRDPKR